MKYIAVIEKATSNYSAFVPDVPGAVGIGKTLEAATESVAQGLALHLYELQASGAALPVPTPREQLDVTEYEPEEPFELLYVEAARMNPVSLELEKALEATGVSRAELARRMNTTPSAISRLTDPFYFGHSTKTLASAATALGAELQINFVQPSSVATAQILL